MQAWYERWGPKRCRRGVQAQDVGDRAWADAECCRAITSTPVVSSRSADLETEQNPS